MSVQYQIAGDENGRQATVVFSDGEIVNVTNSNANFEKIVVLLATGSADEDEIKALCSPALHAGTALTRLSERFVYENGNVYRDGDPINSAIASHIVRIIEEGGNELEYGSLVAFMEKLDQNPSQKSKDSLYEFIVRNGLTIAPDGDFLAYKGVNTDGTSIHSGFGIVNNVVFENAHLMNAVNSVIEMPRSKVDDNGQIGCSHGLHVGTYDYASNFSQGKLLLVKVNPRDVVSVPDDCGFAKIRTCRYVVFTVTDIEHKKSTYAFKADNDWADDRKTSRFTPKAVDSKFQNNVEEAISNDSTMSFDYVNSYGGTSTVENFTPEKAEVQWSNDVLVTGLNDEGDYRSYKASRMSNVVFDWEHNLTENTSEPVVASVPVPEKQGTENIYATMIENIISKGYRMKFDYVNASNVASSVDNFIPETSKAQGNDDVLVVGRFDNEHGPSYAAYRHSRMSNIRFLADDAEVTSVSAESTTVKTSGVTDEWSQRIFDALQED